MQQKTRRGRPPLGDSRMVTVGTRIEPGERDLLARMAEERGHSMCSMLREMIRREIKSDEPGTA